MSINPSELIWTVLCFFVLLFVLKKLLFDPLTRFMDARRARVDEALETERQAQQARAENDEALLARRKETTAEAAGIVAQAHAADEQAHAAALDAAHQETTQSLHAARERLRSEETETGAALEAQMPEFVELLTDTLLGETAAS